MGNCVSLSIPLDQSVNRASQWLDDKVACIYNLEKNLTALERTMVDLMAKRDDLTTRLTREENRGLQRLATFQVWLIRVETLEKKVNDLVNVKDVELQRLCFCGFCSKILLSSYRYAKNIYFTLREVEKLKNEDFDVIAEQALTPAVEERQLQPIIVGHETMFEKAWKHLMKDDVGVMGLFGMGGVGKTTLLAQINNNFNNNKCGFDFVIWVVVSKELHVEKIEDEIAEKIGLNGEDWKQKGISQKSNIIYNFLRKKKFVLFLDDIWEKVDLAQIGIPDPRIQIGCKVAFTTRSQDVCFCMGVEDPMEVQCLTDDDAFDLFQKKIGQITLGSDQGIPDLARIVAKKCCGLPLALNVIGETMSCKRTIQEWWRAIHVLNSYAAEFSGMEDKILALLKYSYDSLKGDKVKSCLLYCTLFPEDDEIDKEKLIEYWMCEGIIDGSGGLKKAEYEGYEIIGSLVRSSLLMEEKILTHEGITDYVRMHDVVREMALWIASDLGKQKEAFIVCAGVGLKNIPNVKNWKVVRRMSLMNNKIYHLTSSCECLQLKTLLLQKAKLETISSEFFKSMSKLAVLDLSYNSCLLKLPKGISELVSLKYLNLFATGIHHLPKGLLELRKLIHLDLECTSKLESIDGISNLCNLKVLKLKDSRFILDLKTVKELEALEHLEFLTTSTFPSSCLEEFLRSQRLMNCSQDLDIRSLESSGISLPETMDKLSRFIIFDSKIAEIKMGRECSFLSLVEVTISNLKGLRELTFVMFAPNLQFLSVVDVEEIEDIINKEKACEVENSQILPFPKLKKLSLYNLPNLENIYWSPLPFPCLEEFNIRECPNLEKLPLDSKSGKHDDNGLSISYDSIKWIEDLDWKDEATKTHFLVVPHSDKPRLQVGSW